MQLNFFNFTSTSKTKKKTPTKKAGGENLILFDGHEVEVRRRAYQRRWNLLVYPTGKIKVTCGKKVSPAALKKWLIKMRPWIEKSLKAGEELRKKYPMKSYSSGELFMLLGESFSLQFDPLRRCRIHHDERIISLGLRANDLPHLKKEKLIRLYKKAAREKIPERVEYWAGAMGLKPTRLSLRGQKTRWGSCSSKGEISLNWKLVAAPPEAMDYVIIHELAHLKHMNHSAAFWNLVEAYCPEYRGLKKWLKDNQFGFEFLSS